MYVRFIAPGCVLRRGVDGGLFGPALDFKYSDCEDPLVIAIAREIDWFNRELPAPDARHFRVKSRRRWWRDGICWFHGDAAEMIRHAHVLAALLRECGVPISKVATRRPGEILYRDDWQIVAKPCAATPVRWH